MARTSTDKLHNNVQIYICLTAEVNVFSVFADTLSMEADVMSSVTYIK